MKKTLLSIMAMLLTVTMGVAQNARQVLDKCAAKVSTKSGASANFTMNSAQYGNASGTIALKGQKFYVHTTASTMWFDGKTLWTYMSNNEEVNISTPTAQQLQTLNPYIFINMYKQGYSYTMTSSANEYKVHLTSTGKQSKISEAFITVDKTTYAPKEIKMLSGAKWTTFTVSGLKSESLPDTKFRFNSAAYPNAEIIDLR